MSGLSREVLKWIQSLDLTWQLKTPKWDLTNGYLTAEIFSWYFPQEIQMHMFNNGTSLDSKLRNWSLLKIFFKRHSLDIPEEFVEGTIHCKEGAAPLLVERIYELLTNREVKKMRSENEVDFTDRAYQVKLPLHARSTACQAVKNNLRTTELMADRNIILSQQKAQNIINNHIDHRRVERTEDPLRFDKKPTLGELAIRSAPHTQERRATDSGESQDRNKATSNKGAICEGPAREPTVQFKEIQVNQMEKKNQNHRPTLAIH